MSRDPKASYYDVGGIEVQDIIQAKLTPEQYRGYLLGCALKYTLRCNFKHDDPGRDIEKAHNHLTWLRAEKEIMSDFNRDEGVNADLLRQGEQSREAESLRKIDKDIVTHSDER